MWFLPLSSDHLWMTPGGLCCSQGAAVEAGAQVLPAGTAVARGRVAPSGDHSGEGQVAGGGGGCQVAGDGCQVAGGGLKGWRGDVCLDMGFICSSCAERGGVIVFLFFFGGCRGVSLSLSLYVVCCSGYGWYILMEDP